ncbi:MAG TPA: IclR family transcriptional regulator, partial [Thermomicrobiales bacterium]|nr:IclR family transcriptional regulator [Thermomicrobiales bacterium]
AIWRRRGASKSAFTASSQSFAPAFAQSAVHSVDKALSIVELLMRSDAPQSARELAERAGINRTTAHRIINALIHRGWIERQPGAAAYRLSLRFLALERLSLQDRDVVAEVRPTLERLARLSRETVHLGVLDGFEVVHVDKVESPERVGISSRIGSRATPHLTGLGKALLAAAPDDAVERYLDRMPEASEREALRVELALTRERGYSIDDEEDSIGVRCLGVAVRGADGLPVFAISLTGPSPRLTQERIAALAPQAGAAAAELSRQFGWEPDGRDGMAHNRQRTPAGRDRAPAT